MFATLCEFAAATTDTGYELNKITQRAAFESTRYCLENDIISACAAVRT